MEVVKHQLEVLKTFQTNESVRKLDICVDQTYADLIVKF